MKKEDPTNQNTKQKILKVAENHFAQDGYQAASLSILASEVGISKAALYHYFENKEEIYREILLSAIDELKLEINNSIDSSLSLEDNFRLVLTNYINFISDNKNIVLLLKQKAQTENPEVLDYIHNSMHEIIGMIQPLIGKAMESGKLENRIDARIATTMLMGAVNALVGEEIFHYKEKVIDTEKIVDYFVFLLFENNCK